MSREIVTKATPGLPVLFVSIALTVLSIGLFIRAISVESGPTAGLAAAIFVVNSVLWGGFFTIEPFGSKVLLLFGQYKGTVKEPGLWFANPFYTKKNLSLRVRTLNGEKLKVNDAAGNPIEIGAIVVWQVDDTFKASFEVEDYEQYVNLQSETALRHSASSYPYDGDDNTLSLRRNAEEVSEHLKNELNSALSVAGVRIMEARLSHLAYSPEIAGAMLRRQQAEAVIAARQKIVDGAVSMVEMALERMDREGVITLDDDKKASMVSNLMVVLCSEHSAQPVVNTGTLYG
jgi:regulator of protease activity HflC (stomatin/prohibitin superfamily)